MVRKVNLFLFIACSLFLLIQATSIGAQSKYPKTISVLQELYHCEIQDYLTYMAYAQKAISENYHNIAYLFVTLATSESIHAHNYKQILADLRVEVKEPPKPEIKVFTTKENLKHATQAELQLIDQNYPQFIEKIKPEKHEGAIRYIMYAWEGDKQHRDLIEKIRSGTGVFFGFLVQKIEQTPIRFFICQTCGFSAEELPIACPISKSPSSRYKEVVMIK
jgi:rubrerythrin